jgi:hypothetical protein
MLLSRVYWHVVILQVHKSHSLALVYGCNVSLLICDQNRQVVHQAHHKHKSQGQR